MEKPNVEQSKKEKKEKKPKYKEELEKRPMPREGEAYIQWLKRIGGPHAKVMSNLEEYSLPEKEEDQPLLIASKGSIVLNDKNILEIYGEENKKKIDKWIEQKVPHVKKEKEIYKLEKEFFSQNPDIYFQSIGNVLGGGHKVVADYRFEESVREWMEESKKEKPKEKPKEKAKPKKKKAKEKPEEEKEPAFAEATGEEKEKAPTLDEQIEKKKNEIEEIERKYNIYYSPAVQDLLGLYYKEKYKGLKGLRKELGELEKGQPVAGRPKAEKKPKEEIPEPETLPEEIPERPKAKDYLDHLKYTDNLFNEMVQIRAAVKAGDMDPLAYEIKKDEWRIAYKKTSELFSAFDEETKEEIIKSREKKRKKERKKKKGGIFERVWVLKLEEGERIISEVVPRAIMKQVKRLEKLSREFWELIIKKVGKETIEEVTKDAVEEQLKVVKKDLKKISKGIREGGVSGRAGLEKEQARLEKEQKRLEEMKKRIEARFKIQERLKEIPKEIEKIGVIGRADLEKEQRRLKKRLRQLA